MIHTEIGGQEKNAQIEPVQRVRGGAHMAMMQSLTYEWVMVHIWMSHGTHMNESWHTFEWVMAHMWQWCSLWLSEHTIAKHSRRWWCDLILMPYLETHIWFIYIYIYTYIYTYVYIYIYLYIHLHNQNCLYIYAYMYIHICNILANSGVMYIRIYIYGDVIYIWWCDIYIHIHIYTYIKYSRK